MYIMLLENVNDEGIRRLMLSEVEIDEASSNGLNPSKYFSTAGTALYPALLREAVQDHDDRWLAQALRQNRCMNATAMRRKPKGGYTEVKVPVTAPDTFAEGEFNRFYARALCLAAIEGCVPSLQVYRAKAVAVPRAESEAKIGTMIDVQALLNDLRIHQGMDTALGLPPGPNSGLSVRLVANVAAVAGSVS
jgi:hypothetical protein